MNRAMRTSRTHLCTADGSQIEVTAVRTIAPAKRNVPRSVVRLSYGERMADAGMMLEPLLERRTALREKK